MLWQWRRFVADESVHSQPFQRGGRQVAQAVAGFIFGIIERRGRKRAVRWNFRGGIRTQVRRNSALGERERQGASDGFGAAAQRSAGQGKNAKGGMGGGDHSGYS